MVGSEATSLITPLVVANAYDTLVDPTVAQQDKDEQHFVDHDFSVDYSFLWSGCEFRARQYSRSNR